MPVQDHALRRASRVGVLSAVGSVIGAVLTIAIAAGMREPVEGIRVSLLTNTEPSYVAATAVTGADGIASLQLMEAGGYTLAFERCPPAGGSVLFTNGEYTLRLPVSACPEDINEYFMLSFNAGSGDIIMVRIEDALKDYASAE